MDHYRRSARNTFAALLLDRAAEFREDQQWMQQQLDSESARFLPVYKGSCLLNPNNQQQLLLLDGIPDMRQSLVFLGKTDGRSFFSVELPDQHTLLKDDIQRIGLRQAASLFDAEHAGLCAYALAMHQWHHNHRFCGRCGKPNQLLAAGHRLRCSANNCRHNTFPRIDPAMIVLITHGDKCLLGRQHNWPDKRYSCLAGFVEPGESLEDAVHREVMEEAGVSLNQVHYHSSQPWPFPSSIMLGFTASASSSAITIGDELEHARWWSVSELQAAVTAKQLLLPYQLSISWQLLADWYQQHSNQSLADLDTRHAHRQA